MAPAAAPGPGEGVQWPGPTEIPSVNHGGDTNAVQLPRKRDARVRLPILTTGGRMNNGAPFHPPDFSTTDWTHDIDLGAQRVVLEAFGITGYPSPHPLLPKDLTGKPMQKTTIGLSYCRL